MGRVRRKRVHKNIKDVKKKFRLRRRTKDLDQIHDDLNKTGLTAVANPSDSGTFDRKTALVQELDTSLPGGGEFFCIHCSRYFIADKAFREHVKSKPHKKRMRLLKERPYTQKEAEMAAGMGSYIVKPKLDHVQKPTPTKTSDADVDMLIEALQVGSSSTM